jgi:excisionase family DNA binding protein
MTSYSVQQIAEMLSTNPETVRRWIRDKKLNAIQISRKDGNVITEAELQRFLKASPKYMPRFTKSLMATSPAVSIPLIIGGYIGSKVAGYLEEKKEYEVRIRQEDIEKYLAENITRHTESIKYKRVSIKHLEEEIQTEEQQIKKLKFLLEHKDLFLGHDVTK